MGFDYSEIAITASESLEEYGQAVTLEHETPGTYDPATGETTGATTTTQYSIGVIIDWDNKLIDGTLVQIGDKRLLLSALDTAGGALTPPVLGDTITDAASVVYSIVAPLKTISPAGTVVMFDVNLRGT